MKEIVVISGKGGTGKTSLTASFSYIESNKIVIGDCDVDAADMHLLMKPSILESHDFFSGEVAEIDQETCTNCGKCFDVCRFKAINIIDGNHIVDKLSCEGCGYCARVCPVEAIENNSLNVGKWYKSTAKTGSPMIHARLGIGADNSGKLVAQVKNEAHKVAEAEGKELIIIDGPPGIGCPVVSSLSGASFVVLVTEPSLSGIHDLKRVHELTKNFKIKSGCIINKHDINPSITNQIIEFLREEDIHHISNIPYNNNFTKAMTLGKTIVEFDDMELSEKVKESWDKIINIVKPFKKNI